MSYIIVIIGSLATLFFTVKLIQADIKKQPKKQISKMLGISFLALFVGLMLTTTDMVTQGLEQQIIQLQEENQKLTQEITELQEVKQNLTQKNSELQENNKSLDVEISILQEENKTLNEEISKLQEENKSLNSQRESSSTSSAGTSNNTTSSSTGTSNNTTHNSNNSSNQQYTTESYQNCTLLREVYPDGVSKDHPAYESKHDRDKDGWACERN